VPPFSPDTSAAVQNALKQVNTVTSALKTAKHSLQTHQISLGYQLHGSDQKRVQPFWGIGINLMYFRRANIINRQAGSPLPLLLFPSKNSIAGGIYSQAGIRYWLSERVGVNIAAYTGRSFALKSYEFARQPWTISGGLIIRL
jgi:outer membrane protein W